MLDHYPYKPFKITSIARPDKYTEIGAIWLSDPTPYIRATKCFTFKEFDKAGYVFAEADATQPTNPYRV